MTGISISVNLTDTEAADRLRELVERMDRREGFYKVVGERLLASTKKRFAQERDPNGAPWTPLKPATIKGRIRKGQNPAGILRARGYLAGSINKAATQDEVRIGSPSDYAAIHQLGGTIKKAARTAKIYRAENKDGTLGRRFVKAKLKKARATEVTIPAHSITIPSRPYIGISADDADGIYRHAVRWLTDK